ncbi:MAG TPA: hypothetical protein VFC25_06270 [Verrucomicrobiae bacterium]|nr:hypothetical protein [Verrucomicrobiae bacterium]
MKVKLTQSIVGGVENQWSFQKGQVLSCPDDVAKRLISAMAAVKVSDTVPEDAEYPALTDAEKEDAGAGRAKKRLARARLAGA